RSDRDWSSDVCSSDLQTRASAGIGQTAGNGAPANSDSWRAERKLLPSTRSSSVLPARAGVATAGISDRTSSRMRPNRSACVSRRSEEHTSELQSRSDLVCRLLLEKKKKE